MHFEAEMRELCTGMDKLCLYSVTTEGNKREQYCLMLFFFFSELDSLFCHHRELKPYH